MKKWVVLAAVILAAGSMVSLAMAARANAEEDQFDRRIPDGSCASHTLRPFTHGERSSFDGTVIAHITNNGEAAKMRVCLFDETGAKKMDANYDFAARESRDVRFETPPGLYNFRIEATSPNGTGMVSATGTMNSRWCLSHTGDIEMSFFSDSSGFGARVRSGGGCVPGTFAVGIVGLVASGATVVGGYVPGLLLYSRLVKPRLLDLDARKQVHDLVAHEPGIHSREVVRDLDSANGQIAYHLSVLAREKLLVSIGTPGFRHWFVAGRFSPEQMRAIVSLRDPTRRRVYEAVVARPGASLGAIAEAVGVSMPQGSRAARALERAGLLERRLVGRTLALTPSKLPDDVFGSTLAIVA